MQIGNPTVEPANISLVDATHRPVDASVVLAQIRQIGKLLRQLNRSKRVVQTQTAIDAIQGLQKDGLYRGAIVPQRFLNLLRANNGTRVTG